MKFTIEQKPLTEALGLLARVVERRTTIPILSNLALTAKDDAVHLRATDLDMDFSMQVTAEIAKPGSITLPAHMLHDIARKMPPSQVTFECDDARMVVKSGRSRFTLPTLPVTDFPDISAGEMTHRFALPGKNLAALIEATQFAISTEETRYYLNGIFLHTRPGEAKPLLTGVATDGHRLARYSLIAPEGAEGMPGIIVPRKAIGEMLKIAKRAGGADVQIECSPTKLRITAQGVTLLTKLIDGTFPDYQRVIPTGNDKTALVDREAFAAALDRVSTISSERGRAVKCEFAADRLTLSVSNPDAGEASEEIEIDYNQPPLTIGFNARYLLDILDVLDKADRITVRLAEAGSPTILHGKGEDLLTVLVPMRV